MRLTTVLPRLVAAVVTTAAAGLVLVPSTAQAGTCSPGSGVTVVVDFKDLGGGAQSVCDAGGGGTKASSLFPANGYPLTYAQRQPGYVCRVSGVPTSDPCINTSPASAYWGLWWSDGKTGTWTYSSLGVASLTIPDGGSVGFVWDDVDGSVKPGVAPPKSAASSPSASPTPTRTPSPTPTPSPTRTPKPTPTPTVEAPTPATSESAPVSESPTPSPTASESALSSPTPSPTPGATPTEPPSASDGSSDLPQATPADVTTADDSLPLWVPLAVIIALFGAAGAYVVRRRARP